MRSPGRRAELFIVGPAGLPLELALIWRHRAAMDTWRKTRGVLIPGASIQARTEPAREGPQTKTRNKK